MKKNGFTLIEIIGTIIILGIIAILAFPPLLKLIKDTTAEIDKTNTTLLYTATSQYIDEHMNDFPKKNGNVYCITYRSLIQDVSLSSSLKDKNGNIIDYDTKIKVTISDDLKYEYAIDNACEEVKINRKDLAQELIKQYNTSNTVGLLKDETGYYYRGTNAEVSNNYVWFAGHLWRVISIDNDNNLTMITQQPITAIHPASAAWTTKETYESSYINTWLNDLTNGVFLKSMEESDRDKILESTFNVGIYTNVSEITTTQKVGLLDEEQYKKSGDGTTEQNSFLDIKNAFWLGNCYDASYVRYVRDYGSLSHNVPIYAHGIRPVIKISNFAFTDGIGTIENPYREKSTTTSTSNIKVGEYISVPTTGTDCGEDNRCLFRVVSKDNDSIKVVLNGLLPSESTFGLTATYTANNTIDTKVKAFAGTIDNQYRYTGNKTFGIGQYGDGANYTAVQTPTYTGNVGLPVIGEIFSGNDIEIKYPVDAAKTFVNATAIENPTVSSYFWIMNAYSVSNVCYVFYDGSIYNYDRDYPYGVRPVLFLKSNLKIIGGNGTAENPFTL